MFCKYCGNEVSDNAYICTNCGCPVKEVEIQKQPEEVLYKGEIRSKVSIVYTIFLFLSAFIASAALVLILVAVMNMRIHYYSGYYYTDIYLSLYEDYCIPAFICGIVAFLSSIVPMIQGLMKKDNIAEKYIAILNCIYCTAILVSSIISITNIA